MSKNILVVSVDIRETRVALIENGIIAELHLERRGHSSTVGNVVLGKVTRVLPGLQAAFIDIGQERAAFLHVEDLIRPDDFDTYLAGGKKQARDKDAELPEVTGDEELDAEAEGAISTRAPSGPDVHDVSVPALPNLPSAPSLEAALEDEAALLARAVPLGEASDPDGASHDGLDADDDDNEEHLDAGDDADEDEGPAESLAETTATLITEAVEEAAIAAGLDVGVAAELRTDDLHRVGIPGDHPAEPPTEADPDAAVDAGVARSADGRPRGRRRGRGRGGRDPKAPAEAAAPVSGGADANETSETSTTSKPREGSDSREPRESGEHPAARTADPDDLDFPGMPGFTISSPGEVSPRAPSPPRDGRDGREGRGRNGRRGSSSRSGGGRGPRTSGGRDEVRPSQGRSNERGGGDSRGGRGRTSMVPGRISKSTPIRDVVKEGQDIIVQVSKDPIGTKGARCTSHVSLPGRYVVYLPTVDHIGISKRIGSEKERLRLRDAIESMKPPSGGLIVRTVAEGLTKKQLKQDVGYLVRLWGEIAKKKETTRAPNVLASELDLVLKTARDLFTDEVHQIVIDDKHQFERLCRFVEMFAPDRVKDVILYSGDEPIFDAYGIEDEIQRALSRKVPLPSGGHLVIDQAEALTAIDVNTGRFVGKALRDMEETILKTNLEAVNEIAYQLRFRNIGGLIILDLIDMEKASNREKVRRTLDDLLQKDKAKTTLNRISDLGLIEMTRKRTRESLGRLLHEPCFYCDGTGQLQSKETVSYEILREIRRKRADLPGYTVVVNVHPAVADLLLGAEKAAVADAENRYQRKITVVARKEYHLEQFDLVGK